MVRWWQAFWFAWSLLAAAPAARGLELQGFLTKSCQARSGVIINVEDDVVSYLDLGGHVQNLARDQIQTLYTFDVLVNPFAALHVDHAAQKFLRAVYVDGTATPNTFAFPIHFVDDLVIFLDLQGQTRVYTYADLLKLRPAPDAQLGRSVPPEHRAVELNISAQSDRCRQVEHRDGIKPTRILNDQIAIDAFLSGFEKGYGTLASFQERTYLYPRPFMYPKRSRLGLTFLATHEEPALTVPVYFQWSSGEPYRFQSFTVVGLKAHEFTPNVEPVFALRTDVKSHVFHALFIGNVAGLPAGTSLFLKDAGLKLTSDFSVAPSFNYMALMGGDVGPYSASAGLFYPDFGVKVGDEQREILGSSVSYIGRLMYTTARLRARVIGSAIKYQSTHAAETDILMKTRDDAVKSPDSFDFKGYFVRGGVDFDWNERLTTGADVTLVKGQYHEVVSQKNSVSFNKTTIQAYVQRHFGHYVSLNAAVNVINKDYESIISSAPKKKSQQESVLFGSMEFLF